MGRSQYYLLKAYCCCQLRLSSFSLTCLETLVSLVRGSTSFYWGLFFRHASYYSSFCLWRKGSSSGTHFRVSTSSRLTSPDCRDLEAPCLSWGSQQWLGLPYALARLSASLPRGSARLGHRRLGSPELTWISPKCCLAPSELPSVFADGKSWLGRRRHAVSHQREQMSWPEYVHHIH